MKDSDWAEHFARQRARAMGLTREAVDKGWWMGIVLPAACLSLVLLWPRPLNMFESLSLLLVACSGGLLTWGLHRRIVLELGRSLALEMKTPDAKLKLIRQSSVEEGLDDGMKAMVDALVPPSLLVSPNGRIMAVNGAGIDAFPAATPGVPAAAALRDPDSLNTLARAQAGEPTNSPLRLAGLPERHFLLQGRPIAASANSGRAGYVLIQLDDLSEGRRLARMRADFLANASHELRTPLAALSGFIETLRGHARNDPEAQEKFLDIMQRQSERMRRLINDLMSLSRIEANELRPPEHDVDLAEITRNVIESLGPVAAEAGVQIDAQLPNVPMIVRADADELNQVIQNLVDNAIKYTPRGQSLRVETHTAADYDAIETWSLRTNPKADRVVLLASGLARRVRFIAFSVTDAGPGIKAEHLPRLSERFYRVESGRGGSKTGTGLGLAIVKHILARSRGGLFVESQLGVGTRFSFTLPESVTHSKD
jgi:two-component system phosphate regulon sensor histidine kinase PhoR